MPPTLFLILAAPFWKLTHFLFAFNWYMGTAVFSGGVFGYICYDLTHYFLHHKKYVLYMLTAYANFKFVYNDHLC